MDAAALTALVTKLPLNDTHPLTIGDLIIRGALDGHAASFTQEPKEIER